MTTALRPERHLKADARALFGAAEDGDAASVARLLGAGVPADARLTQGGETPLMRAAARGHEEVARVLLDAGADASARRADGFTPLILAVFFGHEGVVRLLVEGGADARARTGLGTTAARWAASRGFDEMADLLRAAEAATPHVEPAGPRAGAPTGEARVATALARNATSSPAATSDRVAVSPSDELSIFSRKAERRDSRGESAGVKDVAGDPPADAFKPSSAGVSLRLDGHAPAHPSASTFRLGHFLSSWQGSVGAAMLLMALGVAVFALMRGGTTARNSATPTPVPVQTPAPQAAAQAPTPILPQPTPAFPTPDPLAVMPVTDPAYALPNTGGQPFYVPQQGPPVPVQSNVPGDLTVVSESGAPSNSNSGRTTRKPDAGANDATPARPESRGDADASARAARTPEPEQQRPAPPPVQSNPPPPQPAPQPTPGRPKVIPWPPQ